MRPLPSVAALSLVVCGCATIPVEPELGVPPGTISTRPGLAGYVVAAPHGTSDPGTGEIADQLARRTGFGLVVATGFTLERGSAERPPRRYHVNRPTEGVPGPPPAEEIETAAARHVYTEYERRVRETAQAPLRLYVEIHGNGWRDSAGQIEIATVGVDPDDAWRLRTLLELIRDARAHAYVDAPRLSVLIEPIDPLRDTASGAKRAGILRLPPRALHIEIPRAARTDWRALYVEVLADFLREAVRLLDPPRRASTPVGIKP